VVDAASPRMEEQIKTVEGILTELDLNMVPSLLVLNKTDLLKAEERVSLEKTMKGVAISAINPPTVSGLISQVENIIWPFDRGVSSLDQWHDQR
jgi:GTP-binding protein HflX